MDSDPDHDLKGGLYTDGSVIERLDHNITNYTL